MNYIIVNFLIRILRHDGQCENSFFLKNSENKVIKQDRLRIPHINIITIRDNNLEEE